MLLDRAFRDDQLLRDRLVRPSLRHQLQHLALAWRQLRERVVAAAAAHELRDDGRIERRAAFRDATHGRAELLHVGDAVLEQVADALGALRQELHRVTGLDVLREDEHARLRVLLANLLRRLQPLVGVRRRHADVDDRDVRLVRAHLQQQLFGVARLTDDLETAVFEQACDALPEEDRVLREHDPCPLSLRLVVHPFCRITIHPQGREVNRETGCDELQDPLRLWQAAQLV